MTAADVNLTEELLLTMPPLRIQFHHHVAATIEYKHHSLCKLNATHCYMLSGTSR